jgi:hypothetical protein
MVVTDDASDYINLLVRIAHIICNHPIRHESRDGRFATPVVEIKTKFRRELNKCLSVSGC